jgi:hypothetical protein
MTLIDTVKRKKTHQFHEEAPEEAAGSGGCGEEQAGTCWGHKGQFLVLPLRPMVFRLGIKHCDIKSRYLYELCQWHNNK